MIAGVLRIAARRASTELSLSWRVALALLTALILAPAVLSPGVMLGTDPALRFPQGDQAQALAGAWYYYADGWRLPLFSMRVPGIDGLRSVIFTDSIPLLALAGKLWYRAGGAALELTPAWLWICMLGQGWAMTLLLDQLGLRQAVHVATGTVLALVMPALLFRYWMWHLALCGQFVLILALALALRPPAGMVRAPLDWRWPALLVVALGVHPYLLAMTLPFFLLSALRAAFERQPGAARGALAAAGLTLGVLGVALALGGYLGQGLVRGSEGFGIYSMNLLAPFGAMGKSGLLPGSGHFARGTPGQMEGFNYLGLGLLAGLLLVAGAVCAGRGAALRAAARRQWPLLALLAGLTLYALSTTVYAGGYRLLRYDWPAGLQGLTATFRASGRFFWPVGYAMAAFVLYGLARCYRPRTAAACMVAVAALQWLDTAVLRSVVITEKPMDPVSSDPLVGALVGRHAALAFHPPVGCSDDRAAMHGGFALQLLAARGGLAINSLSGARQETDCTRIAAALFRQTLDPGVLVVLGPPYDAQYIAGRRWSAHCVARHGLHFCSAVIR
ncbi:DUF6311 domain-containing protein [Cupriavidus taiwanensis]|uniref:Transmembrane protein n=1 Tax=Cupriavidus taiwanensis TaxID=164546 RepID=A0A7Z7NP42_9BURK|nr:DUF6311 domain-containing protein [Cupriavidus taiwanensis]SOZ08673.1 conserved hypothetical protein; putative membrane protein [Cupriavidus taiwanensis]SOZ11009.1 conserved hypothetical protein; putative membrane protein [Cupriavidus taiwanensis]SOZ42335.1 conserved hypothetical protein; putative membrane protein [Cupriavidus taiwanensis]SPC21372.1 conserved hypothetical protein; putative membrane protein [Cupriavidus taiwanensis]SPD55512.1 conserved membrane protein of unknown function [C